MEDHHWMILEKLSRTVGQQDCSVMVEYSWEVLPEQAMNSPSPLNVDDRPE